MRCIVTGGAGFIGSNLVDKLVDDGHEVIIFDNYSTGKKENVNPKAKFFLVDISHQPSFEDKIMKDVMTGVDVVFHLAALARVQPSIENPIEYHNTNVNGTLNMLDACRRYDVKRFVFSSSSSVYGDVEEKDLPTSEDANLNPMSPYAIHKLIGEQYCKLFSELYGMETVCLRYFNVYGERQPVEGAYTLVMGVFAQQMLKGAPMTIRGDGEQRRDFTYVGDVVNANIKAGFNAKIPIFKCQGDIFNIGNGDNLSVSDIADLMGGSRVHVEPVIEPRATLADYSHTENILDWKPTGDLKKMDTKMERGTWFMRIGIAGQGYVGTAVKEVFGKHYETNTFDLNGKCNCTDIEDLVDKSDIIFVCVPTPMKKDGSCDTSIVESVVKNIDEIVNYFTNKDHKIVAIKSTVPPGTTNRLNKKCKNVSVIFNPEFLTEANFIDDFKNQNRIIIGGERPSTTKLRQVYSLVFPDVTIVKTGSKTAEMVKYMTNTFLATKVSFANEMKMICDELNIDYDKVVEYSTYDERLGKSHWAVPGPDGKLGFGGSCFPKDVNALISLSKDMRLYLHTLQGVWKTNLKVRPEEDWKELKGRAVVDDK